MDLYQIFIMHNRAWTIREIIGFIFIFLIGVAVSCRLLRQKRILRSQAAAALLLLIFLGVVFGSTVFTRMPDGVHHYNLELFWSWKEVYRGSRELLKENLLNMILLMPMGVLLPMMFHKRMSWRQGLVAGIAVSAVIELCQLILCRGLFEWDDIIHNGIGCMIGCVISTALFKNARGVLES